MIPKMMDALVKTEKGPGLTLMQVLVPEVGIGQVLIKIHKTAICGTDVHIYNWDPWSQEHIHPSMTIGHEYVGEIAAIGPGVEGYHVGQIVSGEGHIVCGRCRNCIESCPTGAIIAPKVIDTGRCISCHTIEREPSGGIDLDGWIFGCDRCQSCCPHNQKAPMHANRAFDPVFDPLTMDAAAWTAMDETEFEARMGATPLTRSGLARIRGNIKTE